MWSGRWPTISAPRGNGGHDDLPQAGRGLGRQAAARLLHREHAPADPRLRQSMPGRQLDSWRPADVLLHRPRQPGDLAAGHAGRGRQGARHRSTDRMPKDADLDRLFEGKRATPARPGRSISARSVPSTSTLSPHKSVTLAAEFAATPAESAMIWHAIDRANDATMRYVARELGWARKGAGGEEGADPGAVGWVSFRHHTARPTLPVQDGPAAPPTWRTSPVGGDPHCSHPQCPVQPCRRRKMAGSGPWTRKRLTLSRARVRRLRSGAAWLTNCAHRRPDRLRQERPSRRAAGNSRRSPRTRSARARFKSSQTPRSLPHGQGLNWDDLSAEEKTDILSQAGLAARLPSTATKNDRDIWREQAEAIGWHHDGHGRGRACASARTASGSIAPIGSQPSTLHRSSTPPP